MKISGRLIKGTKTTKKAFFEANEQEIMTYVDMLEECLIGLCGKLGIPVPIWLKKNTHEFAAFKKTFFTKEQFTEEVDFDKFEIKLEQ